MSMLEVETYRLVSPGPDYAPTDGAADRPQSRASSSGNVSSTPSSPHPRIPSPSPPPPPSQDPLFLRFKAIVAAMLIFFLAPPSQYEYLNRVDRDFERRMWQGAYRFPPGPLPAGWQRPCYSYARRADGSSADSPTNPVEDQTEDVFTQTRTGPPRSHSLPSGVGNGIPAGNLKRLHSGSEDMHNEQPASNRPRAGSPAGSGISEHSADWDDVTAFIQECRAMGFGSEELGVVWKWVGKSGMGLGDTLGLLDVIEWDILRLREMVGEKQGAALAEGIEGTQGEGEEGGYEPTEILDDSEIPGAVQGMPVEDQDYAPTELLTDADVIEDIPNHHMHDAEVDPAYLDPLSPLFASMVPEQAVPPQSTWHESHEQRRAGLAFIFRNMFAFGIWTVELFHQRFGCEEGWCPCGA